MLSGMMYCNSIRPCKPVHPSSWPISCDAPQIHGNSFVDCFRLTISLGVKSSTHS
jgi:hypothetical protein